MRHRRARRVVTTALMVSSGVYAVLAARPVIAAEEPDKGATEAGQPKAAANLNAVVVTGSFVPTTRDAVAVSVTEVDREKIEKSGVSTDVLEILRKSVSSFQGRSNTGASNANNTNQNTAGGAQVQLRNLDTLILVNGRRVAINGIAAIGGKAFVNVAEIPPSAIERIEVISDGSSAIYGSDAIGGVVNIILKSDFQGVEVGARYGQASGYKEHGVSFTTGTKLGGLGLTVSGNVSHTDPLRQNARSFSSPITGRVAVVPGTIGGSTPAVLNGSIDTPSATNPTGPAATAPTLAALIANGTYNASTSAANAATYDLSQFQYLMLKQDQVALGANATYELIGRNQLVAFGDLQLAQNRSSTHFLPIATTVTVTQGAAYNPINGNFAGVNFADWSRPKDIGNSEDSFRVTAGLRGKFYEGWRWEAAYVHSQNDLTQRQNNVLYKPNIPLAIAGGFDANGNAVAGGKYSRVYSGYSTANPYVIQPALDPFARGSALNEASLANVYGTEVISTASRLDSIDASVTGTLFELPAGKPSFAIGASHRRERLSASTDDNGRNTGPGSQLWLGGTFADPYDQSRTVTGEFLELRLPLTGPTWSMPGLSAFDLIGAVRHEKYSDAGTSNVPKVGFRWQPVDADLTIRGSYSKSFTAPTLYAQSGPTTTRLVGSGVIQSVFALANPGLQGQDGNNPNLEPSKATTKSLNIAFKPSSIPDLSLSLEYTAVDQKGYPGGVGFTNILQSVNQSGSASPFAGNVAKGNFPGLAGATPFANPGDLLAYLKADPNNSLNVFAIDRFMNLGGVKVRAYTFTADYQLDLPEAGTLRLGTIGTYFQSYQFQALPYQKFYEYAGTATNGGTGVQGTLPKYRFYTTLDWQRGPWNATLGNTYVSGVRDLGPGGVVFENSTTLTEKPVSRYLSWDLRGAYKGGAIPVIGAKEWTLAIGVNNIFNRMPPLAPQAFTDNNADAGTYSPLGRFIYATAQMRF